MYSDKELADYEFKNVRVSTNDNDVIVGKLILLTWADDDCNGRANIDVEDTEGTINCIYADEIEEIEEM